MLTLILEICAVIATAVVMGLSLAHALELPGKLRLNREQYFSVQPIYYPGFVIGGASEPVSIALLASLLFLLRPGTPKFWLVTGSFMATLAVQVVFWTLTQPVNRFWLAQTQTGAAAQRFFGTTAPLAGPPDWTALRNRWEISHLLRAIAAMAALVLLAVAVAI